MSLCFAYIAGLIFVLVGCVVWWSEKTKGKSMCVSDCKDRCTCWTTLEDDSEED